MPRKITDVRRDTHTDPLIGMWIAFLRSRQKTLDLSATDIAKQAGAGVTDDTVKNYLAGKLPPPVIKFLRIADVLAKPNRYREPGPYAPEDNQTVNVTLSALTAHSQHIGAITDGLSADIISRAVGAGLLSTERAHLMRARDTAERERECAQAERLPFTDSTAAVREPDRGGSPSEKKAKGQDRRSARQLMSEFKAERRAVRRKIQRQPKT